MYLLQQCLNGVILGAVLALFAMGFGLVFANMGVLNVAHEAVFASGAIAAYVFITSAGFTLLIAWPLAVVVSGLVNVCVYLLAVRPLRDRRDRALGAFVATLGMLGILMGVGAEILDHQTVQIPDRVFPKHTWHILGLRVGTIQILMLGISVISFLVLRHVMQRSGFGRRVRAVAFDRLASEYLGVRSERVTIQVFLISGAMAGLAAVPIAIAFNTVDAAMGARYLVLAMAVTVLGGVGSVVGTFYAGLVVGLVTSLTATYFTSSYRDVVVFIVLLGVLLVRPTGLVRTPAGVDRV